MKKLLYVLINICLLAGLFTGCEKEEHKSTIQGVVTNKETGEPLSGVMLVLLGTELQTTTAQDGSYKFDNVNSGIYMLQAKMIGYVETISAKIQLNAGQTVILNIEMNLERLFGGIQGKVTDKKTGNPLSEVTIELQPIGKQIQSAEDGIYNIDSLSAGIYTFMARKKGYVDYKGQIQLVAGGRATLDIEMEQLSSIQGTIKDKETGEALVGVTIVLYGIDRRTTTIANGAYVFDSLQPGGYTLQTNKDGYLDYTKESIQLVAGQTMQLDIEMEKPYDPDYKADVDYTVTTFGLNMDMVYVQGGEFEMGATEEQGVWDWDTVSKPVRKIKLNGYHIGKYEVTQAQWMAVMWTDPSSFKGDNLPVERVSWEDAQEFCRRLSKKTGKKYMLPTEAQWEYAARGGDKSQHYKYAGSNDFNEVAWYWDDGAHTHEVGMKKANELGVYDMSGNVVEWCSDWYGWYDENDTEDPQGPVSGSDRVNRGGGWICQGKSDRLSARTADAPDYSSGFLGFRVVVLP